MDLHWCITNIISINFQQSNMIACPPLLYFLNRPRLKISGPLQHEFGFFGIQFGWDLQRANMGPIYDIWGNPDEIPLLFLAAPLTGLIVQPIIGYMSDRTWHPRRGRRRPYFFVGAVLSTPLHSSSCRIAAHCGWLLDYFGYGYIWQYSHGTIPGFCCR